jgi:uncharacterized membrane protein
MKKIFTNFLIFCSALLILFALSESIGRLGDLQLAKERPELFEPESFHIHYAKNPGIMYMHVIAGMIFLLTGAYQLIPRFRIKKIKAHRLVGKVFLIISLLVSLSALVLALFLPYGDWMESAANLIFGSFLLYATYKAYTAIKAKQVIAHSNWVRRVFFVSLSIATIRLIMIAQMMITAESAQAVMGRSFLMGFLLHVILVELWISSNSKPSGRRLAKKLPLA